MSKRIAATAVALSTLILGGMPFIASAGIFDSMYNGSTYYVSDAGTCPSYYANYNSCPSGIGGIFGAPANGYGGGGYSSSYGSGYGYQPMTYNQPSYYMPQQYNYYQPYYQPTYQPSYQQGYSYGYPLYNYIPSIGSPVIYY